MKKIKPVKKSEHKGEILFTDNPMPVLLNNNLISQVGNGLFVLKGELVKLFEIIENLILDIAEDVDAERAIVPSILSKNNTVSSEYLNSFANQALLIAPINSTDFDSLHNGFVGMNSPTVCYHCLSSLRNCSINNNKAMTAISKCSRHEEGELDDLSRLTNFTMREIIFWGEKEYCQNKMNLVLDRTIDILSSVFDLSFEIITANDPFFGNDSVTKKNIQLLLQSKLEVQALIPFKNSSISVASFNNHGDVFFDRFNISYKTSELKNSCCIGWGYERLIFSILCQKGVDFHSKYYRSIIDKNNNKLM